MLGSSRSHEIFGRLLLDGRYEEALTFVLGQADAELLGALISSVKPRDYFAAPSFQQYVLLSLIQQLSCDLQRNTLLKTAWVRDAMLMLDTGNPMFASHVAPVLSDVARALEEEIPECVSQECRTELRLCLRLTTLLLAS